jgi:hypothetical protein
MEPVLKREQLSDHRQRVAAQGVKKYQRQSPVMALAISRRFADRFRAGWSARSSIAAPELPHLNSFLVL